MSEDWPGLHITFLSFVPFLSDDVSRLVVAVGQVGAGCCSQSLSCRTLLWANERRCVEGRKNESFAGRLLLSLLSCIKGSAAYLINYRVLGLTGNKYVKIFRPA